MRVLFDGGLLEHMDTEESVRVFLALLEQLVVTNLAWLRKHPDTPHPYHSGVVYRREGRGRERWKGIKKIVEDGEGDCEDLAAFLCAWMLFHRQPCAIVLQWRVLPNGKHLMHVLVRDRVSRKLEDPSKVLGMKE